jgi:outer membrane autotransporter protein
MQVVFIGFNAAAQALSEGCDDNKISSGPPGRNRNCGALLALLILAVASTIAAPRAWAANYTVANEAEFRAAIDLANANGETSNTITLLNDVVISDPAAFPALVNPVTVNTGAFALSGANTPSGTTPGRSLSFGSGDLIVTGNFEGGASAPNAGNVAGGTGLAGTGTTVNVTGGSTITGGHGGDQPALTAAGQGGDGANLVNGTLLNDGTITGGTGGISGGVDAAGGAGALLNGGTGHINNGTIRGGTGSGGGPTVGIGQRGLELTNGTLVNNGTIEGGADQGQGITNINSDGVYLSNATLINNSSGVITGGASTTAGQLGGNGLTAVFGTVTVINHGSISGGSSAAGPNTAGIIGAPLVGGGQLTIINSGTISYGVGATGGAENDAIRLTNNMRGIVELHAGSTINGDVSALVARTDDILRLGGDEDDSFDVSAIGTIQQYQGFNIFEKTGASTWTITGQGTNQAAPWDIYAGTLLMSSGSDLGDGAVNVFGGILGGVGTVGPTTNHAAGTIAPGINGIGTLTIAGSYTGDGGGLAIESVLGGDASPTDLLVVTGDTSGTTSVKVKNLGGGGAPTVEGIKIVDVGGVSDGSFLLKGDYVFQGEQAVIGGAFAYTLQHNGVSTPADGDWYLRSSLLDAGVPDGPIYQPGVPLYEAYAGVLLGLNGLPTLQQRVGNRYWGGAVVATTSPVPADIDASTNTQAAWGRIEARRTRIEPASATAAMGYVADQLKLQTGIDGLFIDNAAGRLIGAITGQYGTASADVHSVYGNGKIDTNGYSVGGTLTWYDASAVYLDTQAQVTWFDSDLASDLVGRMADGNEGVGYALGAELGQRLGFLGAWTLTPQAQLVYATVDVNNFTDAFGAQVALSDGSSLLGRLGLSAEQQTLWRDGAGQLSRASFYGIANLYYEFLDSTAVNVSGVSLITEPEQLWGGLGIGGTYNWADDGYSIYGEISANTSLASFADSYSYNGTAGLRVRW